MTISDSSCGDATTDIPHYPATVRRLCLFVDLFMLVALAYWGFHLADGLLCLILAFLLVTACGLVWTAFGVSSDPLRDSRTIVRIRGPVRLLLEFMVLGIAAFGIWTAGSRAASETLLTAAGLCYGITWERLVWLARD
jgi:Protein of unknown function (DUF2568)